MCFRVVKETLSHTQKNANLLLLVRRIEKQNT